MCLCVCVCVCFLKLPLIKAGSCFLELRVKKEGHYIWLAHVLLAGFQNVEANV